MGAGLASGCKGAREVHGSRWLGAQGRGGCRGSQRPQALTRAAPLTARAPEAARARRASHLSPCLYHIISRVYRPACQWPCK